MSASKSDTSGPSRRSKGKSAVTGRPEGRLYFLDLPLETQKQIIAQVSRKDLFSFQRVSPHFLSLASAEIYRDLDLKITNSGDEDNGVPSSHAADALQTICASEYDYGQYIKSFGLGVNEDSIEYMPRSLGHVGDPLLMTRLLWDSKSDSSKFLNTALLLVVRKLRILETFHWDAPIEISGAVYQALHKIQSLRCLRIRLDISPSPKLILRSGPSPPNPSLAMQQAMQAQMQNQAPLASLPPQFVPPPPGPTSNSIPFQSHAAKINNIKRKKAGGSGGFNYWANGRAFSGFKSLHTLTLVGMSNHDCLFEIAECIKASSASLKCLTLSLSTELARKSRKPVPVNNPELDDPSDTEMDDEDELSQPPQPPTGASQAATTTNEADIRKEKLAQESILAKIFDLQSVSAEGKKLEKTLSLFGGQLQEGEDSQDSIRLVNQLMKSLMDSPLAAGSDATSLEIRLSHLRMIKDAAERYISNQETQKKKLLTEQSKPPTPSVNKAASKPLNPLASGFKPSSTNKSPSVIDNDFENLSGPTSPYFDSGTGGSLSNGTPKPFPPNGGFSSLDQSTLLSYLPGNSSSKPASSQPYTSPYVAGSYPASSNPAPFFPYEHSNHSTTGFHSPPGYPSPLQSSSSGAWGAITPSNKDALPSINKYVSNVGQNQKTKHKPAKKLSPAKKGYPFSSEDESEDTVKTPPSAPQPFFAASVDTEALEGSMDVDMEHPDEDTTDLGEDQEIIAGSEGSEETATPRKRAKVGLVETGSSSNTANQEPNPPAEDHATSTMSSDEAMQAYIRATHGLQLEELSLEWVPLKASIVARALDLSVLKRVTLLEVGPQDAFWTLLVRLQSATQITAFKSIHTDNVSLPFVKFLATFEGLEELFMLERNKKQAAEPEPESTVTISTIRKGALRKHMPTLQRLSLRNERNDQWDVDPKTLRSLALKGTKLRELAFSLSLKTYHVLMQLLPHLKSLYALHIITLRSTDRSVQLHGESISFAVDNLSHCPDMKLRYIAMINQVTALETKPDQFRRHLKAVMDRRKDRKGKGKAPADTTLSLFIPTTDDSGSDDVDDILADMGAGETKLKFSTRFVDVKDVKIFSKEIRGGKL